jgi:hypothetical protein
MGEKENVKANPKKTKRQSSGTKKLERRYTRENKKVAPKLNEQDSGPRKSRGKNKGDNSNLLLTEGDKIQSRKLVALIGFGIKF